MPVWILAIFSSSVAHSHEKYTPSPWYPFPQSLKWREIDVLHYAPKMLSFVDHVCSFCFECHRMMCQHVLSSHIDNGCARLWWHLHSNLFVLRHITHGLIQKVGYYQESPAVSLSHSHGDSLPAMNLLILNLYNL